MKCTNNRLKIFSVIKKNNSLLIDGLIMLLFTSVIARKTLLHNANNPTISLAK